MSHPGAVTHPSGFFRYLALTRMLGVTISLRAAGACQSVRGDKVILSHFKSFYRRIYMFKWSEKRLLALSLVIEGKLDEDEIAQACGKVKRTIARWKTKPEFDAKRKEILLARVEEAKNLFQGAVKDAALNVIELMKESTRDDVVRLNSSLAILKSVGVAPDKVEITGKGGAVLEIVIKREQPSSTSSGDPSADAASQAASD